ncbi:MAG: hypothetical protein PVG07_14265 [Acidobacteriota bacterium]
MFRFLILALPLVLLALGLFHFAGEALDLALPGELPAPYLLGRWLLEATGLTALYVLVHERGLGRWSAGLAACWTAWIFRGPVLVLTMGDGSRLDSAAWWRLMVGWFVLYTVCGLMMGAVARSLERRREELPETGADRSGERGPRESSREGRTSRTEGGGPPSDEEPAAPGPGSGTDALETMGETGPKEAE